MIPLIQVADPPLPAWYKLVIPDGWSFARVSENELVFTQQPLGENSPSQPKIWVRSEYSGPVLNATIRSDRSLWQFDCRSARYKILSLTFYDDHNFEGKRLQGNPTDWNEIPPGSNGATIYQIACPQRAPK